MKSMASNYTEWCACVAKWHIYHGKIFLNKIPKFPEYSWEKPIKLGLMSPQDHCGIETVHNTHWLKKLI